MVREKRVAYQFPYKFRHGHVHYGLERSKTFADYKAVSQNVGHSSTKITDETYSNLNDGEVQKRISSLGKDTKEKEDIFELFKKFVAWQENKNE